MTRPFDAVEIVFNPNSTGDAKERAQELADELAERAPELPVKLRPTEHAGHGREIARDAARAGRPLVVSVSGDGGYNDVVNGLMEAGADAAYAAVLAAGNANDHRRVTRERPLADAIVEGDVSRLDLLRMTVDDGREPRYAHSYIGLGITPTVALELENGRQGLDQGGRSRRSARSPGSARSDRDRRRARELRQRHLRQHPRDGEVRGSSATRAGRTTARFEVIILRHTAKWRVLATAVRAAIRGLGPQPTAREYPFRTVDPMPVQVDGEVVGLRPQGVAVTVEIAPGALQTVR